jgi:hypothetical protein
MFTVVPTEGPNAFTHVRVNEIDADAAVLAGLRSAFIILAFAVVTRKARGAITGI